MPLFSRSARTLIQRQRGELLHIKVLQTLGCAAMQAAIDIKVLQTLGMARDRPSPYGKRHAFLTVARGPVPRALHRHDVCFPSVVCDRLITNRSGSGDPDLQGDAI